MLHKTPAPTAPSRPWLRQLALLACGLLLTAHAHAHTEGSGASGFLAGYLHPLSGVDHLLAMVAVGMWGAALGRPLIWALPVVFPLLMVVGGVLGIAGVPLPFIEAGIAVSVLVLGLAIALAWRAPLALALAIVALFGVLHGHAHGTELPQATSPEAYAAGFVVSTGILHLSGIALGLLQRLPSGALALRGGGALIAAVGGYLLVSQAGLV
ncbi:MAG: HupE/UreJ family protein [Burkholderiaceae bacterium]